VTASEQINIKMSPELVNKVDLLWKSLGFGNRTDFIKQAVREKIERTEGELTHKMNEKFNDFLTDIFQQIYELLGDSELIVQMKEQAKVQGFFLTE